MIHCPTVIKSLLVAAIALLPLAAQADKRLYKWVDDKGEVHYSDQVPPEQVKQERSILNQRGITMDRVQAAKTPEQIAEEKRQAKLREEQRRLDEEQAAQDRVLLNTFQSEEAIIKARDAKISAIDNIVRISEGTLKNLDQKQGVAMKSAANLERTGKRVTPELEEEMRQIREQMEKTHQYIEARRDEQESIRREYEKDIQRYRELKDKESKTVD